jgi:WhiB family redox-sensing transcriptional regulator
MLPEPAKPQGLLRRPPWHADAACRGLGVEKFFPGSNSGPDSPFAVCARCPVRTQCLEYALEDPTLSGVWGGTSVRLRHRLRKRAS